MSEKVFLIDKSRRKIEYTLKWSGINIESKRSSYAENVRFKIIFLINFFWLNTDLIGSFWWFIQGVKEGKSLTALTYSAPCIIITVLTNFKCIPIFLSENEISELINSLKELEKKQNNRPKFSKREQIIESEIKFLNMILNVYNFVNWLAIVSFFLMPMIATVIKYFRTNKIELFLPLLILYPFDSFDIRFWPFVYIHQIWSVAIVIFESGGTDYLFYILSTHIRIQFRLLKHDIEKVFEPSDPNEIFRESEEFNVKLVEFITWHENLLRLVKQLEAIYSKSTLLNFIASSTIICFTGFNVTNMDDKAFVVIFSCFLLLSLLQIFFLCYFGDILMRSSIEISDAVYNCKWYVSEALIGKKLNIIQIRAQRPSKVTAYGFADVNLRAFTKILSTAWSYFALLNTVYSARRQ